MRKTAIFTVVTFLFLITSCGGGSNKEVKTEGTPADVTTETVKEEAFPAGYPQEITLPEGFTAGQIRTGEGSRTNSEGTITYKTFVFEKMMPKNRAELITHYKTIVEEQQWEGQWRISDEGETGSGTFKKDNMEMEIKVTDMLFTFTLSIF